MAIQLYKRLRKGRGALATAEEVSEAGAPATSELQGMMSGVDKFRIDEFDFLTGFGAPTSDQGLDGYNYLDLTTGDIYSKSGGVWSLVFNLFDPPYFIHSVANTGSVALTNDDSGKYFTNEGTGSDIVYTLPPALKGLVFHFVVVESFYIQVQAVGMSSDTDRIVELSSASGPGGYIRDNEINASLSLVCVADGQWNVMTAKLGNWTIDS